MGEDVTIETKSERETLGEARNRFWQNYLKLGGRDPAWFDIHVEALLKIAVPQLRPVYSPPVPRFDRSSHLPWGPEQFIDYYSTYEAVLTA
jgi:hypothetical protein